MTLLTRDFFARPTLIVARELLGQKLVRKVEGQCLIGRIVETEAYIGAEDSACHASRGRTNRTEVMFGPPGYAYVYLIYGIHFMLNFTTEPVDFPAAVLIRAIEPLAGQPMMQHNRRKKNRPVPKINNLTNGPGKLCQALNINRKLNNIDITTGPELWLGSGYPVPASAVAAGPRIGIGYAQSRDQAAPWRFWLRDNRFVSVR